MERFADKMEEVQLAHYVLVVSKTNYYRQLRHQSLLNGRLD